MVAFAEAVRSAFARPGEAAPEDQIEHPVSDLVKAIGAALGLDIETRTQPRIAGQKVRPDIAVYGQRPRGHAYLMNGYIKLKQPGLGDDPRELPGKHNKEQRENAATCPT